MKSCWLFLVVFAATDSGAVQIEVTAFWNEHSVSRFAFFDGKTELCRFEGRASAGQEPTPATCRFILTPVTKTLTVSGRFLDDVPDAGNGETQAKVIEGRESFKVRDTTGLVAPLRDASLSINERWKGIAAAEKTLTDSYDGYSLVKLGKPATAAELEAAEKRLGFPLPSEYRAFVTQVGAVEFGDHGVVAPALLVNARKTILGDWGYAENGKAPAWISPAALKLLDRSAMLFLEVGDGVGAELYLAPPSAACNDGPAYLWMHEETIDESMTDLAASRLHCKSFAETIADLYVRHVVAEHAGMLMEDHKTLLVDFGAPVLKFDLRYYGGTGKFQVNLNRQE